MFASKDIFLKSSGGGAYQISRSVRLRSSASAYFNRTLTTPTNNLKWTWSAWIKRGKLATANQSVFSQHTDASNRADLYFDASDNLNFYNLVAGTVAPNPQWITTQVFRDPAAWYHIVVVWDSANATAGDRTIIYVNGVRVTAYSQGGTVSLNQSSRINSATLHNIAYFQNVSAFYDGYLTEINFIDGQALTPSSFGETNAITGVWQPKAYSGTYGTNGFELNFSDNSTAAALGTDFSGNSNTWTVNNISVTAGTTYDSMVDSPTAGATSSNYAVLSFIDKGSEVTLANGNLSVSWSNVTGHSVRSTFGIPSGQWYWEVTSGGNSSIGLINTALPVVPASGNVWVGGGGFGVAGSYGYAPTGLAYTNNTGTSYGASFTTGDVIGVAFDSSAGTLTFYKNGTSQGVAYTGISTSIIYAAAIGYFQPSSSTQNNFNFGQRPFAYTPPTGFVALNTQNLPTPTISNGASYMAATTYTGTGSALTIANTVGSASFQPDLVWVKGRSGATDHAWYDAVRGVQNQLESNTTTAETAETTGLTAFGSTGFTVGALAQMNTNAATYVAWQWNAGGSTVTNTSGSISAQVRANPTAGFSVVTYTGTGSAATVGHGLGVAPRMIIIFERSPGGDDHIVYHASLPSNQYSIRLNTVATQAGPSGAYWNSTSPTSSVFSVGTSGESNQSTATYVAYCFAAVAGYSAFNSYTGNGSTDGPFVYLGFRPRYLLIKASAGTASSWLIIDTTRMPNNPADLYLLADSSGAEGPFTYLDITANGFKIRTTNSGVNTSTATYIYMAFAENPFKNSLAR